MSEYSDKASTEFTNEELEAECCDYLCVHEDVVKQVKENLLNEEAASEMTDFFKAFADVTRIKILRALWEHELCVCDIAKLLNMTQSAISHQLRFLKQSKLIKNRRDGKTVFYSLDDEHVQLIINCAFEHINE